MQERKTMNKINNEMHGILVWDSALVKHFPNVIPMEEKFVRQEAVLGAGILVKRNGV